LVNKQKRIALLIEQGFGARIIMQTDILRILIENELEPIILTSGPKSIKSYLDNTPFKNIPICKLETEAYDQNSNKLIVRVLRMVRLFSLRTQTVSDLFAMEIADSKRHNNINNKIVTYIVRILVFIAKLHPSIVQAMIRIENKLAFVQANKSFFDQFKPNILLTTSIGTFDHDAYVLRESTKRKIKTISYILSWDNTTVRGYGINQSSNIITWSEIMKSELIHLHNKKSNMIQVGGVPHYDVYNSPQALWTKEELYSQFNLPLEKDIIVLGTKSPNAYKSNPYIAKLICESITNNPQLKNCTLLVRLHPIYFRHNNSKLYTELEIWESLVKQYGPSVITIDYPKIVGDDLRYLMPDNESIKLGSILRHSKAVINMFSTLNIEASIFDTPTINVSFQDNNIEINSYKTARFNIHADERQTHNQRVLQNDATVVAYDPEQLEYLIIDSIKHPETKQKGRLKLVETECGHHIGSAASRIGNQIIEMAKST